MFNNKRPFENVRFQKKKYTLYLLAIYIVHFFTTLSSPLDKNIKKAVIFLQNLLIAEIKKQMYVRGWKNADLAKATGYKKSTIDAYMTDKSDRSKSKTVENAICKVLDISN